MGGTRYQSLTIHTNKNYKNKGKKKKHHHNNKNDKKKKKIKRDPCNVRCYTCDERDTLQETVLSGKRDTILILLKTMNQQTKDS